MRVFVAGTGRCGTATFHQASKYITNYTSGYESSARHVTPPIYRDGVIEVDCHLGILLGHIIKTHPGSKFVHLVRDRDACARSLAITSQVRLDGFMRGWLQRFQCDPKTSAYMFYDLVNATIAKLIADQDHITFQMEKAREGEWERFWHFIGARGDYDKSLATWERKYNPYTKRGYNNYERA